MAEQWNPELVAQLEAERARIRRPSWSPATRVQVAELVDAVINSDRDGKPGRRRRLRAVS